MSRLKYNPNDQNAPTSDHNLAREMVTIASPQPTGHRQPRNPHPSDQYIIFVVHIIPLWSADEVWEIIHRMQNHHGNRTIFFWIRDTIPFEVGKFVRNSLNVLTVLHLRGFIPKWAYFRTLLSFLTPWSFWSDWASSPSFLRSLTSSFIVHRGPIFSAPGGSNFCHFK